MKLLTLNEAELSLYFSQVYQGKAYINGKRPEPSNKILERLSPAHKKVVGIYPEATPEEIKLSVSSAKDAFEKGEWGKFSAKERSKALFSIADKIEIQRDRFALMDSLESGKPLTQSKMEIDIAVDLWRYAASVCRGVSGETYNQLSQQITGFTFREPVGVVSVITPWNFPFLILSQKLPFALAAGCTVILKPGEFTNGSASILGEILEEIDFPAGAVNIIFGRGETVGKQIAESNQVNAVSFTGSTAVGREIAKHCGNNLKKVSLELGGKNSLIVFPDSDRESMIDGVLFGLAFNAGECCNSISRLILHDSIYEQTVEELAEKMAKISVGDPLHPETKVGALISEEHLNQVFQRVERAKKNGALSRFGGNIIRSETGFFFEPTLLTNVSPNMECVQEEIFGPVLSVMRFSSKDEAICLSNQSSYGLSAGVWSQDISTCMEISKKLQAGTVWINTWMDGFPELPFGGFKQSGMGRELGKAGLEEFTEIKTVQVYSGARKFWDIR